VDSNDTLYGSDPKFISEINKMCSVLLDEILAHLKYLNTNEEFQKQVKDVHNNCSRKAVFIHRALILYHLAVLP
jgi:hypothetical protein